MQIALAILLVLGLTQTGQGPPPRQLRLEPGVYDCITPGGSGRPLVALAFRILDAQSYSDPKGEARGTYERAGQTIRFREGHLAGEVGELYDDNALKLGGVERCSMRSRY